MKNKLILFLVVFSCSINVESKKITKLGTTPLHWAAYFDDDVVAKVLLKRKYKVNARDDRGKTPLHYAAENNSLKVAKLLLDYGADINIKNRYNETALDNARQKNFQEMIKFLESKLKK